MVQQADIDFDGIDAARTCRPRLHDNTKLRQHPRRPLAVQLRDARCQRGHDLSLRAVQRDHILQFFGWLINEKHKDKPAAISTVTLYKSALKWHYKENKLIMSPEVNQELDTLLKGYQRRVSDHKLEGRMPVFEGKYHLPFQGYVALTKFLFRSPRFDESSKITPTGPRGCQRSSIWWPGRSDGMVKP